MDEFITNWMNSPGMLKINEKPQIDHTRIAQLLRSSWFTELLVVGEAKNDSLLPYSNPWSMVQLYYIIYLSIRAYFLAFGRKVSSNHTVTLRTIAEDLINVKDRFPLPLSSCLSGMTSSEPFRLDNSPQEITITLNNPLVSPYAVHPWQHYGLLLKTTRARQLKRSFDEYRKKSCVERLPKAKKQEIAQSVRPTTIFDGLYRIRIRSNYSDVDSFVLTSISDSDSIQLSKSICRIIYRTLLIFEILIAKSVGKQQYEKFVINFTTRKLGKPAEETALLRWNQIKKHL
ncbi:MAG: hypothetical protein JXB38_00765 [Anaerolineales bacterium]|nr:hypothetical protein [Anaerolineales bacterium]